MELMNKILTTTMFPLEEAKTGENIRREILKLLVTKFGLDASSLSKIVWVTDEAANIKLALQPYQRLDCIDHVINTVLRHGLDIAELSKANGAPDIGDAISQAIYHELHEKLEARGKSMRIEKIAPDTLGFLIDILKPFYKAQRELEVDKYPTLNRVCLWCEKLKHNCQPNALDSTQQAVVRKQHEDWLARMPYMLIPALFCKPWLHVH
ncbi:hypothetical protein G5714_016445 [Onychostoma macrolepis]|uniref:Uncharacterized protein n=1 Tax=Onychostoma macrolepis TaxID=369639 RepID=A0A7J6CCM6_9TELE|nr:hypothetical protein G5714_016445 [Onychostoma macrolepis]